MSWLMREDSAAAFWRECELVEEAMKRFMQIVGGEWTDNPEEQPHFQMCAHLVADMLEKGATIYIDSRRNKIVATGPEPKKRF